MTALPVASPQQMRARARRLVFKHPAELARALLVHGLAAALALVTPRLVGAVVEDSSSSAIDVTRVVASIIAVIAVQAVLAGYALFLSARLGEKVLAELREEFVANVLAMPLASVEEASDGDLLTRATRDIDTLATCVRHAVPDVLISFVIISVTIGGLVLLGPLLALPCLLAVPSLWLATRWYLKRARDAYLRESQSYSQITEGLTETVRGARTVDALGLAQHRTDLANRDIAGSYRAERKTIQLLTVYLPIADVSYVVPVAATLLVGGLLEINGLVTLSAVTAAVLYTQQLLGPVDRMLYWMNQLQVGGAALARVMGVAAERPAHTASPIPAPARAETVHVRGLGFSYREGHEVLHHIDLEIRAGERLAIVGSSGAGKSTLGKLLAGVHPPSTGSITMGNHPLSDLPFEELRRHICLVTQENHVFRGSLKDNVALARPDADDETVLQALRSVDAGDWADRLGLYTVLGGEVELSPSQAQQVALARIVVADPRVLVLDEATSLLAPKAARHLERSLNAVMEGRTVVAIAHRLHTAHDADRIVVMTDGKIAELGSHDELLAAGGHYASLWKSWQGGTTGSTSQP